MAMKASGTLSKLITPPFGFSAKNVHDDPANSALHESDLGRQKRPVSPASPPASPPPPPPPPPPLSSRILDGRLVFGRIAMGSRLAMGSTPVGPVPTSKAQR